MIENKCVLVHVFPKAKHVQVNLIITLSFGSMKTDRVISEPCYLRNEFHFSGVHGAMNRSGSRAK